MLNHLLNKIKLKLVIRLNQLRIQGQNYSTNNDDDKNKNILPNNDDDKNKNMLPNNDNDKEKNAINVNDKSKEPTLFIEPATVVAIEENKQDEDELETLQKEENESEDNAYKKKVKARTVKEFLEIDFTNSGKLNLPLIDGETRFKRGHFELNARYVYKEYVKQNRPHFLEWRLPYTMQKTEYYENKFKTYKGDKDRRELYGSYADLYRLACQYIQDEINGVIPECEKEYNENKEKEKKRLKEEIKKQKEIIRNKNNIEKNNKKPIKTENPPVKRNLDDWMKLRLQESEKRKEKKDTKPDTKSDKKDD
jgi:hypothetical protein